jgi:hypothetical protein
MQIWYYVLLGVCGVLSVACLYVVCSRERVAAELSAVRAELHTVRWELRELGRRAARARTPAKTIVLPAYLPADPEEFRRTSVRLARYSSE